MDIVNAIAGNFWFVLVSIIITLGTLASLSAVTAGFVMGLIPPMYRFGLARWKKIVYIVGNPDSTESLKEDLDVSGIVRKKNIRCVDQDHLNSLKDALLMVLCSDDISEDRIMKLLAGKNERCGAIVYAKKQLTCLQEINSYQHVSVVNTRGRLANEVVVLLISTSFSKKDIK